LSTKIGGLAFSFAVKKILLIGRGQIGSALAQHVTDYDVHIWPHDMDDLTSEVLEVIAPDAIINAAGKTDLAWCEANAREALRSNLEAPVRLYQRILQSGRDIRFIHFSSGCIWDGPYDAKGQPFTPDAPPTPACLYSWTKAASDAMLLDLNAERIAILRPRQVYSGYEHPRNSLIKLLRYPKLIDTPNSVSSIDVIEKTVQYALTNENNWSGVWNVYDRGITSPLAIGELLWKAGLREQPFRISKEELDAFHKPKRVDTVLQDDRFESAIQPEDVQLQLTRAIEKLKETSQIL
jgi:nucleoside-diphosphate-sugar epimerase